MAGQKSRSRRFSKEQLTTLLKDYWLVADAAPRMGDKEGPMLKVVRNVVLWYSHDTPLGIVFPAGPHANILPLLRALGDWRNDEMPDERKVVIPTTAERFEDFGLMTCHALRDVQIKYPRLLRTNLQFEGILLFSIIDRVRRRIGTIFDAIEDAYTKADAGVMTDLTPPQSPEGIREQYYRRLLLTNPKALAALGLCVVKEDGAYKCTLGSHLPTDFDYDDYDGLHWINRIQSEVFFHNRDNKFVPRPEPTDGLIKAWNARQVIISTDELPGAEDFGYKRSILYYRKKLFPAEFVGQVLHEFCHKHFQPMFAYTVAPVELNPNSVYSKWLRAAKELFSGEIPSSAEAIEIVPRVLLPNQNARNTAVSATRSQSVDQNDDSITALIKRLVKDCQISTWNAIQFRIDTDDPDGLTIILRIGQETFKATYVQLGFADRNTKRKTPRAVKCWEVLRLFLVNGSISITDIASQADGLSGRDPKAAVRRGEVIEDDLSQMREPNPTEWNNFKQQVHSLNERLSNIFGLTGKAIVFEVSKIRAEQCYRPLFIIPK